MRKTPWQSVFFASLEHKDGRAPRTKMPNNGWPALPDTALVTNGGPRESSDEKPAGSGDGHRYLILHPFRTKHLLGRRMSSLLQLLISGLLVGPSLSAGGFSTVPDRIGGDRRSPEIRGRPRCAPGFFDARKQLTEEPALYWMATDLADQRIRQTDAIAKCWASLLCCVFLRGPRPVRETQDLATYVMLKAGSQVPSVWNFKWCGRWLRLQRPFSLLSC